MNAHTNFENNFVIESKSEQKRNNNLLSLQINYELLDLGILHKQEVRIPVIAER